MPKLQLNLTHDLRFALRQLRRSPGFAITGVLTLALAIGAACVMFAVVHSTSLEPLPYPAPERLIGLEMGNQIDGPGMAQTGESAHFLIDHAGSFASFGIVGGGPHAQNLSIGSGGVRAAGNAAPQQRLGKVLLTAQVALATALLGVGAVFRRGFLLTALGLAAGLVLNAALGGPLLGFIAGTLNVSPGEASAVLPSRTGAILTTTLVMSLTALLACLLPARRAAGVQPTEALRAE